MVKQLPAAAGGGTRAVVKQLPAAGGGTRAVVKQLPAAGGGTRAVVKQLPAAGGGSELSGALGWSLLMYHADAGSRSGQ